MIDRNLNIESLSARFRQDGVVTVEHWLDTDFASSLHAHFSQLPDEIWSTATKPSVDGSYRNTIPLTPENKDLVDKGKHYAKEANERGEFSFILNRLVADHEASCSCVECILRNNLGSSECASFVRGVTGFEVRAANGVFVSWYDEGHFLSPHNDKANGTLGFIYHLSKDWKLEYGGNLILHDDNDVRRIRETFVPIFNCVTIFNLTTRASHTHSVSRVTQRTPTKRLTVTGWWT